MEPFSALLALCAGNSPVPVNSPHKGQWRGALMFFFICSWINDWVNNRNAGDLRRHRGHYDVNVMTSMLSLQCRLSQTYFEVWAWMSNHIPSKAIVVITYIFHSIDYNLLVNRGPWRFFRFIKVAVSLKAKFVVNKTWPLFIVMNGTQYYIWQLIYSHNLLVTPQGQDAEN